METTEEDARWLEQALGFHHLAVEDCLSPELHTPKVDDFGDYLFLVVHGIDHTAETDVVQTTELGIFLGPHFVVSNHNVPLYSVEAVRHRVEEDARPMKRGPDFLVHALVDALVDNVLPTIDRMGEVADDIEEETIRLPQQSIVGDIMKLKRSVFRVHRVMAPQRELLNRLSRGEFPIISQEATIFYRDIHDHLVRITDLNQTLREMADNALTIYLSAVANRQNDSMKVLAMVATVFMPLSLLAGIYGMNFENMPELGWSWSYFAVLGVMGAVLVGVLWWFWARRWLIWSRRQVGRIRSFAVDPATLAGHLARRPRT
jgi:magnesium transporter